MTEFIPTTKNIQDATKEPDVSRRGIAGIILGAVGAAAMVGCREGGGVPDETVGKNASALNGGARWFDTIQATSAPPNFRASPGLVPGEVVSVGGYAAAGDGGGGLFVWTSDTTTADDGAIVIVPSGTRTGCWKRMFENFVNVKWFGAVGDNAEDRDDAVAINAAIHWVAHRKDGTSSAPYTGGTVFFPMGGYRIKTPILLYPDVSLLGESGGSLTFNGTGIAAYPGFTGDAMVRCANRQAYNYGITITNLNILLQAPNIVGIDCTGMLAGFLSNIAITNTFGTTLRGATGLLFSSNDGANVDVGICFFNKIQNLSINHMATGLKIYSGAVGSCSTHDFDVFNIGQCDVSIQLESTNAAMGCTFKNGYVNSNYGMKDLGYTGNAAWATDNIWINMEFDSAGHSSTDMPVSAQLSVLGYPEPTSTINTYGGMVASGSDRRMVAGYQGYAGAGETAANPANATANNIIVGTLSFWAKIPQGTELQAGAANVFTVWGAVGINAPPSTGMKDIAVSIKVRNEGGLVQAWSSSCEVSQTQPTWNPTVWFMTYAIKIFVNTTFKLTSDMVFFVDALQSTTLGNTNRTLTGFD